MPHADHPVYFLGWPIQESMKNQNPYEGGITQTQWMDDDGQVASRHG